MGGGGDGRQRGVLNKTRGPGREWRLEFEIY